MSNKEKTVDAAVAAKGAKDVKVASGAKSAEFVVAKDAKAADAKDAKAADAKDAKAADAKDAKAIDAKAADAKDAKAASDKAKAVAEPAPVEPDSIFIDHGAILPEYVPGTCLYALVRDPWTLFVYWNATFESNNGWLLTAYDADGNVLQSFVTPARRNGRGYFRVPTARVTRVTLALISDGGHSEVKLESKIRIAEQLGIAQPAPAFDERWVDFQNHEVVYEAPAPGRAPESKEVYADMKVPGVIDGAIDRAAENPGACSLSSRFGKVGVPGAPGSSDILVSSGIFVR